MKRPHISFADGIQSSTFEMGGIPYAENGGGAVLLWVAADRVLESAQSYLLNDSPRPHDLEAFEVLAGARKRVERTASRHCRRERQ